MGRGSTKILVAVAIIALLAGSWYTLFSNVEKKTYQYNEYLTIAKEKRELKQINDANSNYLAALEMKDTIELREEIADFYKESGLSDSYIGFCEQIVSEYPYNEKGYIRIAEYYHELKSYENCFAIINKATKRGVDSERLNSIREDILYVYNYINLGFEQVSIFSNGCCAVKRSGGNWGYVNSNGSTKMSYAFLQAGDFNGTYAAVQRQDGRFLLVDGAGIDKSVDSKGRKIEDCGYLFEDKMPVKYNGKYHYCDSQFNELFGEYDYAGTFSGGIAAAMNDGKWFVINSDGVKVTEKTYEEIVVDEKGVAFRNNVAFAKEAGKYILIDSNGNRIGDGSWVNVDAFNSDQPAAVSNGERWGFIDSSGNLVKDYEYGCAKSFSNGFAAVSNQDNWGYIILDDYSIKIAQEFKDAMDFGPNGSAFVKRHDGWDLIKLYSYN